MMTCQKVFIDKFNYFRVIVYYIMLQGFFEIIVSIDYYMNLIVFLKFNYGNLDIYVFGFFRFNYWFFDFLEQLECIGQNV